MSGKSSMYDEEFEQSLLAAIFPKATVAAGSFYRYVDLDDPLARDSGEVWQLVALFSLRRSSLLPCQSLTLAPSFAGLRTFRAPGLAGGARMPLV